MGKGIVALVLVFLLLPGVVSVTVDKRVSEALEDKQRVNVIVMLKDEPGAATQEDEKERINEQQRELLDALDVASESSLLSSGGSSDAEFILDHRYSTINGMSGSITEEGLEQLMNHDGVASISIEEYYTIAIDDSVPRIGATIAKRIRPTSLNLSGFNQTVCVIDTGIDYEHDNLGNCSTANYTKGVCPKIKGGHDFCADDTACATEDTDPIDVHGHGTHVSGIIASNHTTFTGIAPDVNLLALKVCNSSGSCPNSDIIAAIDWCIDNRTKFNISIITMSLGGGLFSAACDNNAVANASNKAVGNGLFVSAATGNDGSNSQVGSPACGSNVTGVGSVTLTDGIASTSNRAPFNTIFAPGDSITSLDAGNDGTVALSGTSMATPHVAGVAALLLQFNSSLRPKRIKSVFNITGTPITDGSNVYYRINVSAALQYIDSENPVFSLNATNSSAIRVNASVVFNITVNDTVHLRSYVFAWNDSGTWKNVSNATIEGTNKGVAVARSVTATRGSVVGWRFHANDSGGNTNSSTTQFFTVANTAPILISIAFNVTNLTAANDVFANTTYIDHDGDVGNVTFVWYRNGTNIFNDTFLSVGNGTVLVSNLSASNFSVADVINVTVNATDSYNVSGLLVSSSLTVVNNLPVVTLQLPANGSTLRSNFSFLNWSAIDGDGDGMTCHVYGNATVNVTSVINRTSAINGSDATFNWTNLNETTYYWKVQCDDGVANGTNSSIFQFKVAIPPISAPTLTSVKDYDSDGNIEINWTDDGNESGESYRVYRFTSPILGINSSVLNLTTNVADGTQFYEDVTTLNNTMYWYALVTVDNAGNYNDSRLSGSLNGSANDTIRPQMTSILKLTSASGVSTLNWSNTTTDINSNTDNFSLSFKIWNRVASSVNFTARHVNETATFVKTVTYAATCRDGYCSTTDSLDSSTSEKYTYFITTLDDGGNENLTLISASGGNALNVTATTAPKSGSSGGSGGGGGGGGGGGAGGGAKSGYTFDFTSNADLNSGAAVSVAPTQGSGYKIKVAGREHTMTVSKLYDDRVVVVIASEPISTVFKLGDEKEFDIDEDTVLDLYVRLNGIDGGTADFTIKKLNLADAPLVRAVELREEAVEPTSTTSTLLESEDVHEEEVEKNNTFGRAVVGGLIALLVFVVSVIWTLGRRRHHRTHTAHHSHPHGHHPEHRHARSGHHQPHDEHAKSHQRTRTSKGKPLRKHLPFKDHKK